jgi:hypothetical protein
MPKEHEVTESEEFSGKFVRVRGRLSRKGEVRWSPCLRTEKGPIDLPAERRSTAVAKATHRIDLLDYRGESLESTPVQPHFFARDQEWATFVARLPYRNNVQSVRLRLGELTLGALDVPTDRPYFTLLNPTEDSYINPLGILHVHWCGHDPEDQYTFFVRYSHNGRDWLRPGVNLHVNDYYLDLREMPGGKRCVVQVLATNGYRTSFVQTRHFEVPTKIPDILVGNTEGPVLFAQGFSRQDGPIVGESIVWFDSDGTVVHRGGSLDLRTLNPGTHSISVSVKDQLDTESRQSVGTYQAPSGELQYPLPL